MRTVDGVTVLMQINQLGLSIVRLDRIDDNQIHITNIDTVDGTPLLDIKPFVPAFDCLDLAAGSSSGWLEGKVSEATRAKADDRFISKSEKDG